MHFAIISSNKDSASSNIKCNLLNNFNFQKTNEEFDSNNIFQYLINNKTIKLYTINGSLNNAENIDNKINADFFIFISKHVSKENKPAFTAHPIGNWGRAEYGGKDGTLCQSNSFLLKKLFLELVKSGKTKDEYELTLEATHHGPYVEKPAVFVEIGSTEKEWKDKENGKVLAKAVINAAESFSGNENYTSSIFFGGGHYSRAANKAMLETDYAIGHICPKYGLESLNEELLEQAINKITPKPEIALLDWKGLSTNKQKLMGLLKKFNIKTERI